VLYDLSDSGEEGVLNMLWYYFILGLEFETLILFYFESNHEKPKHV
jgi:hypothetical protein